MISINYQTYGNTGLHLRLRLYQDGETRYIRVTHLLSGQLQKKHWNQKKQAFSSSAPHADENNDILFRFKQRYQQAALSWTGSLYGFIASVEEFEVEKEQTIEGFIQLMIAKAKENVHADGTLKGTFEEYLKIENRLKEFCAYKKIEYSKLGIKEITPNFIHNVFAWIEKERNGLGLRYISKGLHSLINKADKAGYLNADDFKRCQWHKDNPMSSQKFNTLTKEQIKSFKELDLFSISKSNYNELYRDFCLFILYTGQSACDAAALRKCDRKVISGVPHFIFRRRKIAEKQIIPCAVPISKEMEEIMARWEWRSKDGYIFPIRTKKKINSQTTNNGDIKHFIGNINPWLKKIGAALGLSFPLRSYTFRHTAITNYVSQGIPLAYISNMMGTSVENIEKVYYNNLGDAKSRNAVLNVMQAL